MNQWNEIIPILGKDLNLILVEVRGHGKSWPPPLNGTIEQLAKDVMAIADKSNIELQWIKNASHGLIIEEPEEVARTIMQFVEKIEITKNE